MAEVYLASSAIAGFDGQETVECAFNNCFDGVQLFLDPNYRKVGYTDEVLRMLQLSRLGLIIHLPNQPNTEDIQAARYIAQKRPGTRMLIHYLPATFAPNIPKATVGWENSITGKHDPNHILETQRKAEKSGVPFVYDFGRSRQSGSKLEHKKILQFIKTMIGTMDPIMDIIHAANQTSWDLPFRQCESSLAVGIWKPILPQLKEWQGILVIENENLQLALDGLRTLKSI